MLVLATAGVLGIPKELVACVAAVARELSDWAALLVIPVEAVVSETQEHGLYTTAGDLHDLFAGVEASCAVEVRAGVLPFLVDGECQRTIGILDVFVDVGGYDGLVGSQDGCLRGGRSAGHILLPGRLPWHRRAVAVYIHGIREVALWCSRLPWRRLWHLGGSDVLFKIHRRLFCLDDQLSIVGTEEVGEFIFRFRIGRADDEVEISRVDEHRKSGLVKAVVIVENIFAGLVVGGLLTVSTCINVGVRVGGGRYRTLERVNSAR